MQRSAVPCRLVVSLALALVACGNDAPPLMMMTATATNPTNAAVANQAASIPSAGMLAVAGGGASSAAIAAGAPGMSRQVAQGERWLRPAERLQTFQPVLES